MTERRPLYTYPHNRKGRPNRNRKVWSGHPPVVKAMFARQDALGWTDRALADRAGYVGPYISLLRQGHNRTVPLLTFINLAEALGLEVSLNVRADAADAADDAGAGPDDQH